MVSWFCWTFFVGGLLLDFFFFLTSALVTAQFLVEVVFLTTQGPGFFSAEGPQDHFCLDLDLPLLLQQGWLLHCTETMCVYVRVKRTLDYIMEVLAGLL